MVDIYSQTSTLKAMHVGKVLLKGVVKFVYKKASILTKYLSIQHVNTI